MQRPRLGHILVMLMTIGSIAGCIGSGSNSPLIAQSAGSFPTVRGINLHGETVAIPAELQGERRIVIVAFEQRQQTDVDTWINALTEVLQANPKLSLYELPVIYEGSAAFRFWVNNGMRSGIPDSAARSRTITVYTDREAFYAALNVKQSSITTFVINKSGAIEWRADGPATEESLGSLRAVLAAQG